MFGKLLVLSASAEVKAKIAGIQRDKSLPCAAIPTRYILQEPPCPDKLLQAMKVTNVRLVARGVLDNKTRTAVTKESLSKERGDELNLKNI